MCPITQMLFEDPVFTSDGHTYSRAGIEYWLKDNDTSPSTGATLRNKTLTSNFNARKRVLAYKEKLGLKVIELVEREECKRVEDMLKEGKADLNARRKSDGKTALLIASGAIRNLAQLLHVVEVVAQYVLYER